VSLGAGLAFGSAIVALNSRTLQAGPLDLFRGEVRLPSSQSVKLLSSGYHQLAADYYWLAGIQYFGDRVNQERAYGDLDRYLEMVTDLDPGFCYAYVFAGNAVPQERYDGLWANTGKAIKLLERGVGDCPEVWKIHFLLGYVLYTFTDRYQQAGDEVAAASHLRGAPSFLGSLATRLYGQEGDLETARDFARAKLSQETDPFAINELKTRLLEIQLEMNLRDLRQFGAAYTQQTGKPLKNLDELVESGLIRSVPPDPLGGQFFVDPTGKISTHHEDRLLRLHVSMGGHLREPVFD
jgi:tetratricopeptide (TPR) repeat protein